MALKMSTTDTQHKEITGEMRLADRRRRRADGRTKESVVRHDSLRESCFCAVGVGVARCGACGGGFRVHVLQEYGQGLVLRTTTGPPAGPAY